jgi:aconitate hydratase
VVAYALAGSVTKDLMTEPVGRGRGRDGRLRDVYLGDIWPTGDEVHALLKHAMNPKAFVANYAQVKTAPGALWSAIDGQAGEVYDWPTSTYIAKPPFFDTFTLAPPEAAAGAAGHGITGARVMALFGDSITTDHISPAGSIKASSPAGLYLKAHGVSPVDFNSYGSRRGNHEVMMRGTFANVRIKNLMLPALDDGSREEGGWTLMQPTGEKLSIYDAAMRYQASSVPTVIFAGEEYGTGSSRDWAAKGTQLLGIQAVVARSFERIHRNNLVGMGVLPLQFQGQDSWATLGLRGDERIDIALPQGLQPQGQAVLTLTRADGTVARATLTLRIDTPIEVAYYEHGGILPYVLRQLLQAPP